MSSSNTTNTGTMGAPSSTIPSSPLSLYRILSPTASLRISPLCLGAMTFGDAWSGRLGSCPRPTAFAILDAFHAAGGNFIDTANTYQAGDSETWLGEWMAERGVREQMVIATKYSGSYTVDHFAASQGGKVTGGIQVNTVGNGSKSLMGSVRESLRRLRTGYVDVLYVHFWDYSAGVEEVVVSLNVLVQQGLVLYLGVSDTPAWIVVRANAFARAHGLRGFSVYQGMWNVGVRDLEREVLPMCEAEGMGVVPFGVLGSGAFKTGEERRRLEGLSPRGARGPDEKTMKVCEALERVAGRHGTRMTSVALAWVMGKYPYVTPVVGGRGVEHLQANIEALELDLSEEDVKDIEGAVDFDVGFPQNLFGGLGLHKAPGVAKLGEAAGRMQFVEPKKAIKLGQMTVSP